MELQVHPAQHAGSVKRFAATAGWGDGGGLRLSFRLDADLGQLLLPVMRSPRPADGLWQHTCFELFVARRGAPAYHEFNFSPSGEWAAYAFGANRRGMRPLALAEAPAACWQSRPDRLDLEVMLPVQGLPPEPAAAALRIGLCAVIEAQSGTITHWALRHMGNQPDFHHPDSFVLELESCRQR